VIHLARRFHDLNHMNKARWSELAFVVFLGGTALLASFIASVATTAHGQAARPIGNPQPPNQRPRAAVSALASNP